jgi:hypothetical protein
MEKIDVEERKMKITTTEKKRMHESFCILENLKEMKNEKYVEFTIESIV